MLYARVAAMHVCECILCSISIEKRNKEKMAEGNAIHKFDLRRVFFLLGRWTTYLLLF